MIHYIEENRIVPEVIQCKKLAIALFTMNENELCQKQVQILHNIEKLFKDNIEIFQIKLEDFLEVKMRYDVTSFPALLFFKEGKEIERIYGIADDVCLVKLLQDLLNS